MSLAGRALRRPVAALGPVVLLALATGLVVGRAPMLPLLALGAFAAVVLVGVELCIAGAWLASFGLFPFIDADLRVNGLPLWLAGFGVAALLMVAACGIRQLQGKPSHPVPSSALLGGVLALLGYTIVRLAAGSPFSVPTLALPFLLLPIAAVVTPLWLSHPSTLAGLRRAAPFVLGALGVWALALVLGSTGRCSACLQVVSSTSARDGLLGAGSRLFVSGGGAFVVVVLVAVAVALRRPSQAAVLAALLGLAVIALQASRAQYGGVLAALALLVAWRARWSSQSARIAIAVLTVLAMVAILSSPVGERGLSAVSDLQQHAGNAGYRLDLLQRQQPYWSLLGSSVSPATLQAGIDYDLGGPNSVVVLGWVGTALQVVVLALGVLRGLRSRTTLGAGLAAVCLCVLLTRISLPYLEAGESAAAFGLALGALVALPGARPRGLAG